uniref:Epiplakin-like n=1 Tax=Callorhinchus milii TaxID=7868 RepID=A0A4W3GFG0_CALMI
MKKELIVESHGIRLLEAQIATGGIIDPHYALRLPVEVAYQRGMFDKEMNKVLSDPGDDTKGFFDPNTQDNHTYLQLKERCMENKTKQVVFRGLRRGVSAQQLLKSKIIDQKVLQQLKEGTTSVAEVSQLESGTGSIAGIILHPSGEKMSIYQANMKKHLMAGTALILLEAQAATGFIIDPVKNLKLSVDEAVKAKVIGSELHQVLLSAERAVTGYKDPYTGNTISLFQAMKKDLIVYHHGIRLLEAQIATGGIIDPVHSHRLPVHVAYDRGMFDAEMNQVLEDPGDDTKGFFDPNTKENLTYLELKKRCVTDSDTGLCLLSLGSQKHLNDQSSAAFKKATVSLSCGKYKGKTVSVWEAYHSEYLTEEDRMDLVEQFNTGKLSIESVITRLICIIEQTETTEVKETFTGLRSDVTAKRLLESDIIDKQMYEDLKCGTKTVIEISQMDLVKKYLEGTGSIAGVLLESSNQTMSIYEAKRQHWLMPGTALVLLEAQAATGFVIDPVKNLNHSVDEAVKARIIGPELHAKLLSAERAVTGYKDPYTGNTISLFQALKKDLIVKQHGIRLLEAQIATGGIIDPVNSHRLPVHVAYKQGFFDEEMNRILEDPGDDTKGFFDPNTKENLTYLELKKRCLKQPSTDLWLLVLKNPYTPKLSKLYYSIVFSYHVYILSIQCNHCNK